MGMVITAPEMKYINPDFIYILCVQVTVILLFEPARYFKIMDEMGAAYSTCEGDEK
jgi:hypothetical protein